MELFRIADVNKRYIEKSILITITNYGLLYSCTEHGIGVDFHASYKKGIIHSGIVDNEVDIDYL